MLDALDKNSADFVAGPRELVQSALSQPPRPLSATPVAISAVIPCLNEEQSLGLCIEKAFRAFQALRIRGEVVICDNGSTDRSVEIAERLGARVVRQPIKGYGAALRMGIEAARGEIIIMADADDSYDWSALAPFVHKVREGHDLVVGNRFLGGIERGAMPWLHKYVGNPVLSMAARTAFGTKIGDFHCGMRAFTRSAYRRMQPATTGMEFATEMIANAAHQGLSIAEVPTRLHRDKRGRPPHLRSFRDGWRHLRFIATYAPDHLYLAPGLTMLALGVLTQLLLAGGPIRLGGMYFGIHFVALGALLSLVGFNVFNLGMLAKTIMSQRYSGLKSRTVTWVKEKFTLELGLVVGGMLVLLGACIDGWILVKWLRNFGQSMPETVHLAFAATTAIVLGLNVIFSSFLLSMISTESGPSAASSSQPR